MLPIVLYLRYNHFSWFFSRLDHSWFRKHRIYTKKIVFYPWNCNLIGVHSFRNNHNFIKLLGNLMNKTRCCSILYRISFIYQLGRFFCNGTGNEILKVIWKQCQSPQSSLIRCRSMSMHKFSDIQWFWTWIYV